MLYPTCTKCGSNLEVGQEVVETILITNLRGDYISGNALPSNQGFRYRHVECPEPEPEQQYKIVDERDPACVEKWSECEDFRYDIKCCRFPKNCSAGGFRRVTLSDDSVDETITDASNSSRKQENTKLSE